MIAGITRLGEYEWEVPVGFVPGMRVPGRYFLSGSLETTLEAGAVQQLANVATLPGIIRYSLAMPDIHWGYGFPIGGVAAFEKDTGVVSPGGVGFDINCGVRLLGTPLSVTELTRRRELVEALYKAVPTGIGAKGNIRISGKELDGMMTKGAGWAVSQGYGVPEDEERCEERGRMVQADAGAVSGKAKQRGTPQGGTLGAGNHFLEIQVVKEIFDPGAAEAFGLKPGQVVVMIHCGSRGLGHQTCTDHLKILESAVKRYNIPVPDRQLACAPIESPEGKAYFSAMAAAANYAWANRQMIMHAVRRVFETMYSVEYDSMHHIYDVAHNVAKMEEHIVDGRNVPVCVHRKGATRAFGPGHPDLPSIFSSTGQPVIIPGSMGTSSYLLKGTSVAMERTFGSTCHGAGRVLSRSAAKKNISGSAVKNNLAKDGIIVCAPNDSAIAEEAPDAYKPSSEVVRVVDAVGLSRLVARFEPLGVIKG